MRKSIIVLLLFISLGCSQSKVPTILSQEYFFLTVDGEVQRLKQSKDTLYSFFCYADKSCHKSHYKIIAVHVKGVFTILKLEDLDTIPLSENLCPGKPYSMIALKSINSKQLGYCDPLFACLTKYQLDTIQINSALLGNKSFLTFFSNTYLKEFSVLKKISSKKDVRIIINAIEDNNFGFGRISYSAEQLNNACIEKGYNPIDAGRAIDSIMHAQ